MDEKQKVLIVEDEKNIVDILRFNLLRAGYDNIEAYDGEAGLALARSENPDLLPYYTWTRDVCCIRTEPIAEDTFGPELETRVAAFLEALIPLYDFCNLYKV